MASVNAIEAIGLEEAQDWHLRPDTHAAKLPDSAGPLKRILLRPDLEQIIETYNEANQRAIEAQSRYKRLARLTGITSFLAVAISSFLLLPSPSGLPKSTLTVASLLQGVLIASSFVYSLLLIYREPFAEWMRSRAEAEHARIKLFARVLAEEEEQPQIGELPLLPLQLEYFRRYQLDVQRYYYANRGRQHARNVRIGGYVRIAALLIIIVAALLPMLWGLQQNEWVPQVLKHAFPEAPTDLQTAQRVFLSLGLLGGALQGLLAALALVSHDQRNAVRYLDTAKNLEDLATRPLEEARRAALEGDRERVLAFVALVHEQVSSEHREWIALKSVAPDLALDRLRDTSLPRLS